MTVEFIDGKWVIDADWLENPIIGDTFEEIYWKVVELRRNGRSD
jgi:hypothetical protein